MKKRVMLILLTAALIGLTGCSSGVSQEKYDKGATERDESFEEAEESIADTEIQSDISENSMYIAEIPDTEENILKNVEIKTQQTDEGDIVVFLTNNNSYIIPDIELQVVYYKDGDIINTDEDGHDVLVPGNTVVSKMDAPDNYDDYEVIPTIEWDNDYKNWIYNLRINSNLGDDQNVILQIENVGGVDIEEIEYIVVFYSGDDIVDTSYAQDVRDLGAGDKIVENVDSYGEKFDGYAVYINQAHTFFYKSDGTEIVSDSIPDGLGTIKRE